MSNKNDNDMTEIKEICDRELKTLHRLVDDKEKSLRKIEEQGSQYER